MKVQLVVCNVCKDTQLDTKPYAITSEGRRVSVDLCEQHSQPLEAFLGEGNAKAPKSRPSRRGRVMTMEEIEQRKQAQAS